MLCSTIDYLKISAQQTRKAIAERQGLLARTNDPVAAQVIERGIEKLKEIVEMHAQTEKVLLLQTDDGNDGL